MNAKEHPTIGVIGHTGMVGSVIFEYYSDKGFNVLGYSRKNQTAPLGKVFLDSDFIFVCVPTPYNWETKEVDLSAIHEVLGNLKGSRAVVILKSTVPPRTTEELQKQYPDNPLIFNPEFLSEKTAMMDFVNPDRQIVGYTPKSYKYCTQVLDLLPNSPFDYIMTSTEAEVVKYVNNFHGSLMVIFANLIFDICEATGANFESVKRASQASKWVGSPMGRMYWNVTHGGFRGYGGKCFPKDMNNLDNWLDKQLIPHEVLKAMIQANQRILADQGMTEQDAEKRSNR